MLHQARLPGHQPRVPLLVLGELLAQLVPLLQLGAGVVLDGEQLLLGPPPLGCPHCHVSLQLNVYCVCDVCSAIVCCVMLFNVV